MDAADDRKHIVGRHLLTSACDCLDTGLKHIETVLAEVEEYPWPSAAPYTVNAVPGEAEGQVLLSCLDAEGKAAWEGLVVGWEAEGW